MAKMKSDKSITTKEMYQDVAAVLCKLCNDSTAIIMVFKSMIN